MAHNIATSMADCVDCAALIAPLDSLFCYGQSPRTDRLTKWKLIECYSSTQLGMRNISIHTIDIQAQNIH